MYLCLYTYRYVCIRIYTYAYITADAIINGKENAISPTPIYTHINQKLACRYNNVYIFISVYVCIRVCISLSMYW